MTVSMSGDSITSCTPVLARVTNTAFKKSSVASVPLAVIMGKQTLNAEIADDMVDDDMVDDDMVDVSASRAHCTEMRSKDAEKNLGKKIAAGDDSEIVTSLMRADGLTVCPGDYVLVLRAHSFFYYSMSTHICIRYSALTHLRYSELTHLRYSELTHLSYSVFTNLWYSVLANLKYTVFTHLRHSVLTNLGCSVLILGFRCSPCSGTP